MHQSKVYIQFIAVKSSLISPGSFYRDNLRPENNSIEELKIESLALAKSKSKKNKECKFDRFRLIYKRLLEKCVHKLNNMLLNGHSEDEIFVTKVNKQARSKNSKHPEKRSKYIGVSKNGENWQSLVCYKKEKVYINTLKCEKMAGELFDFFTFLNHFDKGKMNHSYTIKGIFKVSGDTPKHLLYDPFVMSLHQLPEFKI